MKPVLIVLLGGILAGCGVDGDPVAPTAQATATLSSSGAHLGGAVGVTSGPVALSLSL